MPLSISPALKAHLGQTTTTLATCTKLDLLDGTEYRFTDHDQPIDYNGDTYVPTSGYSPSAADSKIDLSVDNLNIIGVIDDDALKVEDLLAGKFDYAEARISMLNYADTSMGELVLIAGKLGRIEVTDNKYVVEIRGLTQHFAQSVGEPYTVLCTADLGDTRCTVDLAPLTQLLTVAGVDAQEPDRIFTTDLTDADDFFNLGLVTVLTGDNTAFVMDVKKYTQASGLVELYEPMPFPFKPGDTANIHPGCDKTWETCKNVYANKLNYRGFKDLPGLSRMVRGS